jgi:hypothetical protein
MQKIICLNENANLFPGVVDYRPEVPLEIQAAQGGAFSTEYYAVFEETDFNLACYNFPQAFSLTDSVVSFSLDKAKQVGNSVINQQSNEQAKKNLEGLSYDVYIAQSALPTEQRIVKYQAAIDANNAIALETEQREQAIYAATTIDEVNAIVYPSES